MVSIIIPLKNDPRYLQECINACTIQTSDKIEIIVLPDKPLSQTDPRVIQETTGPVSPAKKRNIGVQRSRGEFLAFIDDDTRPLPGWLNSALKHFRDPNVAAVGGPSITPADDPFRAQVSGAAYESWMLSGSERHRYLPGKSCNVQDFPSCNLIVRRSAFEAVEGFGTDFWPGEDTAFCLALVKKGFRIRYEPNAVIEHHRRPSLMKHFQQLGNYGLHRGYFAKRFPETSRRLVYFLPSLLVITGTVLTGFTIVGNPVALKLLIFLASLYFLLVIFSLLHKPFAILIPAMCVIFLSHLKYGISFIKGLMARRLPEENKN